MLGGWEATRPPIPQSEDTEVDGRQVVAGRRRETA